MIALALLALASADAAPTPEPEPPAAAVSGDVGGAARVMAAFRTAEAARGPLEGLWRISTRRGEALYLVDLADPGDAPDPRATEPDAPKLEGSWLDLARSEALSGSGYLAAAKLARRGLVLLFFEGRRHGSRTIRLRADGADAWSGDLAAGRRSQHVIMTRAPLLASGS